FRQAAALFLQRGRSITLDVYTNRDEPREFDPRALPNSVLALPSSVAFADGGEYSELVYARQGARHLGLENYEVVVDQSQFLEMLPHAVRAADEPLADLTIVPLLAVPHLARVTSKSRCSAKVRTKFGPDTTSMTCTESSRRSDSLNACPLPPEDPPSDFDA